MARSLEAGLEYNGKILVSEKVDSYKYEENIVLPPEVPIETKEIENLQPTE